MSGTTCSLASWAMSKQWKTIRQVYFTKCRYRPCWPTGATSKSSLKSNARFYRFRPENVDLTATKIGQKHTWSGHCLRPITNYINELYAVLIRPSF